jgi:two-component system, LytTR family, sensor kinase
MNEDLAKMISFDADIMKKRRETRKRKGLGVLLHITGWIILFILPQFLITGGGFQEVRTTLIIFFNTLVFGIIFYVNYLWLIPSFLHKGRWPVYVALMVSLVVVVHFASDFAFRRAFPPPPAVEQRIREAEHRDGDKRRGRPSWARMAAYNYFITAFLVTGFAVGLRSVEESVKKEREIKELEKEKLNSELALLKNQVSPHFFFNTLNNIYSLIEINQKDAQGAVLSLSKLMRYMLYESEQGDTKLSRDLDFMKVYIDLMRLRINDKVKLTVDFPENFDDINIPPLLFIPFIENAFKHGVSYQKSSFIQIGLSLDGNIIRFKTANSFSAGNGSKNEADSGIGLENVRKRLALLYPGKHELKISEEGSVYSVELVINKTEQEMS